MRPNPIPSRGRLASLATLTTFAALAACGRDASPPVPLVPIRVDTTPAHVPPDAGPGRADLEVVASDAANVSRRRVAPAIGTEPPPRGEDVAYAGVGGVVAGAAVLLGGVLLALLLRRSRKPRPLSRVLLAGSVKRADDR